MKTGIDKCPKCGAEVIDDITINQFIETYGVRKDHLAKHGLSYFTAGKYGDTPINDLPKRIRDKFISVLNLHGVKYAKA